MVVLIMLGIVAMVAAAVTLRSQSSLRTGQLRQEKLVSEDAAYSGLQFALSAVEVNGPTWGGVTSTQNLPQLNELGFQIKATPNTSPSATITDADGTIIPPGTVYIKTVGYLDGKPVSGLTAIFSQEEGATFNYPAFATNSVTLNNSTIDAIDSSGNPAPGDAPIRTNGDMAGAITLGAGSFVDGDVTVGRLGDAAVALVATGGSAFSGAANVAGNDLPLPNITAGYDDSAPGLTAGPLPFPVPPPFDTMLSFLPVKFSTPSPGTYSSMDVDNATFGLSNPIFGFQFNILILEDGDYYTSDLSTGDNFAMVWASGESRLHVRDSFSTHARSTSISTVGSTAGPGLQVYQTAAGGSVSLSDTTGNIIVSSQGGMSVADSALQGALYGPDIALTDSQLSYRTELDGMSLAANVDGKWNFFGIRQMTPSQVSSF